MKISQRLELTVQSRSKLDLFIKALERHWAQLTKAVSGNISFGDGTNADNVSGVWLTPLTPGTPNTDFTVSHPLARVPAGYIVMSKSAACDLYTGSSAPTATTITFRASVAGVTLKVFLL